MSLYTIKPFTIDRYDDMLKAWKATPGLGLSLSGADDRENISRYLDRNPGGSYIAEKTGGRVVGGILAGHDGRRGYLHHLFVLPEQRNQRIGKNLVDASIKHLSAEGIDKSHIFVFNANESGKSFWDHIEWQERNDITIFSKYH
ncbi:MAG: GNAT family N-acetyltransferase [Bacteroidetes bacterium]|nr:GNAT family N-acetyltransferase [Bacteroidota bacterium]